MGGDPKLSNIPGMRLDTSDADGTYIKHRELGQDSTKFFIKAVLRKFDLAHVKVPYPADFEVFVDDLHTISVKREPGRPYCNIQSVFFVASSIARYPGNLPPLAQAQSPSVRLSTSLDPYLRLH